jgi:hypothetical protein
MAFLGWLDFPTALFGVLKGRLDDFAWMSSPTTHQPFSIMASKVEVVK